MKFVIKDLMITVLPLVDRIHPCDGGPNSGCMPPSAGSCGGGSPCSCGATEGRDWSEVFDPPFLIRMKQHLRLQIAQIEAREQAMREAMRPSQEHANLLEPFLAAALEELKKTAR